MIKKQTENEFKFNDLLSSVERFLHVEEEFRKRSYNGPLFNFYSSRCFSSENPIIVGTPFSVQTENQPAVPYTGLISKLLYEHLDCSIVQRINNTPNFSAWMKHFFDIVIKENKQLVVLLANVENEANEIEIGFHTPPRHESSLQSFLKKHFHSQGFDRITTNIPAYSVLLPEAAAGYNILYIGLSASVRSPNNDSFVKMLYCLSSIIQFLPNGLANENRLAEMSISERKPNSIFPHHRADINLHTMHALSLKENDYTHIFNYDNGFSRRCIVKLNDKLRDNEIAMTLSTKQQINLMDSAPRTVFVQKEKRFSFTTYQSQKVGEIEDGKILVSAEIFDSISRFEYFELVNGVTGASFDISIDKIKADPSLSANTMKLGFLQRQFLDYQAPPEQLSAYYYSVFSDHSLLTANESKQLSLEEQRSKASQRKQLLELYHNEAVIEKFEYEKQEDIKKMLKIAGYVAIHLYPLQEYKHDEKKPLDKLVSFTYTKLIGQSKMSLKVVRPYSSDEANNAIRISPAAMKLLGIEETDNIIIRHREHEIVARVLELGSFELLKDTNIMTNESNMNIFIGIPAHIRSKLGLPFIGKAVTVERHMPYLFRKNLNIQFLPILAVVFTAYTLDIPTAFKHIITILMTPVAFYLTLSRVREKISNK